MEDWREISNAGRSTAPEKMLSGDKSARGRYNETDWCSSGYNDLIGERWKTRVTFL
jgi:hypothetical protein